LWVFVFNMADTAVAITAGTGTNIDTRTEGTNGNHRQVVVLGDPATNAGVAPVDVTSGLKVNLGADNDVTVSGSVSANAGTNLNTSALALETTATSIKTAVETIDNAISGSEMQVDVVGSLPAGTNAIGKLAANSGVDIGDVDVTSLPSTVHSADYDTGGGTDTTLAFGLAVPASGGAAVIPGDATAGLKVDLGSDNDVTVTGSVTANAGTNLNTSALALETTATSIKNAVETIDNAISGNEMQVDVVAPLPGGTNAIGKLAANSGVDIGDVDILSIAAGDNNIGNVDLASAIPAGTNAIGKIIPPDYDVTSHSAKAVKYYTNAGAVTDGIIWSPAAGKRWHVTTLFINVSAAATVTLEDDLAGGDSPIMKMELAANSGVAIPFGDLYPLTSGEDAADLIITTSAGNVYVTAVGYEI
jgi:hypothetical protein